MLIVIEDSDGDYGIYNQSILYGIPHVRFSSIADFKKSEVDFDVVLTDLSIIDSSSSETVRKIREETEKPIFVLTGAAGIYLTGRSFKSIMDAGATEVFEKNKTKDKSYSDMIRSVLMREIGCFDGSSKDEG